MWTQPEALALLKALEPIANEKLNCHVALTGGVLYKDGPRKDLDLIIYPHDNDLFKADPDDMCARLGLIVNPQQAKDAAYGDENNPKNFTMRFCTYRDKRIDVFFMRKEYLK